VVQEEATKASKRAQRRAAEGENAEKADAAHDEDEASDEGDDDPAGESAEPEGAAPNRQARRTAAAQARARRKRERAEATAIGLDAGEMVDDALVRFTDKLSRVARANWNWIQWAIGLGIIGWFGYQVYAWRHGITIAKVSDSLFAAVDAERGRIGDPKEQGTPNENGIVDPTPIFETHQARLEAAAARYAEAAALDPGSVASSFARLGQAGVHLALNKPDEARAGFEAVVASKAAEQSPELRGNALEGQGASLELKSDWAAAARVYEQLASVPGFELRSLYQQARVKHLAGDNEAAKGLLSKLFKELGPPPAPQITGLPQRPEFLRERASQLASSIDPLEKDVKIPKAPLGADAIQQMLQQLESSGAPTRPPAAP
jgi:tetratricopeptide (TPR) repeat protein